MSSGISLVDLLGVLPGDARATILGAKFSRLVLAGTTPAARERITRLKLWASELDGALAIEALAGRLPALEVLECDARGRSSRPEAAAADHGAARHRLLLCTVADCFPRLRRAVLPLPLGVAPGGLGVLAACANLRELRVVPCALSLSLSAGGLVGLTTSSLEGLAQLQQLQSLTLGNFHLHGDGAEQALAQLLTSARPPRLRKLQLLGLLEALLEVDFEELTMPATGAVTRAAGATSSWRMRTVAISCSTGCPVWTASRLAAALLAAADQLQQQMIPELAFPCLSLVARWHPPEHIRPGDALPCLIERCERVQLGSLAFRGRMGADAWEPEAVVAVIRLLGRPASLRLWHGDECVDLFSAAAHDEQDLQEPAQEPAQAQASCCAAAAEKPQPPASEWQHTEGADRRKELKQDGGRLQAPHQHDNGHMASELQHEKQQPESQQRQQRPPLQLGTATPEQVLREALDRLWAEAEAARGADRRGADDYLIMIRGCRLQPAVHGMALADSIEDSVEDFFIDALMQQERREQQQKRRKGADGAPTSAAAAGSLPDRLRRCWRLVFMEREQVAIPSEGVIVLECGPEHDAALQLAELLTGGAAAAASGPGAAGDGGPSGPVAVTAAVIPDDGTDRLSPLEVLDWEIYNVLMDLWDRSRPQGGSCSGSSGSSGTTTTTTTTSCASSGGNRTRVSEEVLGRLRQLLALDHGVRRLWETVVIARHDSDDTDTD
ncbi:hypothetical protein HYH02_004007 [Chlamydomonas schloesseri]|uniref:Uncharacterized protein n=1 Tax=Chlamydomonas schloesseri TaxID=2026947 RepID=A0A835WPD6_9CHLO|nr:hypothetical protein HYH02_004007 [Chlamydomonas schloesseri]|eukprot:KAG2451407.1 hypothetical protein HYH02_004007 [Chlamydomonas schloesseri]